MSSSPPPGLSHPIGEPVPGSWPERPAEVEAEAQPQSEPQSFFNLRAELKRGRGRGGHRHRGRGRYQPRNANYRLSREELRDLAVSTLETIDEGRYFPPHSDDPYDLVAKVNFTNDNTAYYAPDDPDIENWNNSDFGEVSNSNPENRVQIVIREYSTLVGIRRLHHLMDVRKDFKNKTIGVLNFASAKKPGGGFLNGSQAQEESIARSSTLYPSLLTPVAMQFYEHYTNDPQNSFYTHAMVYSPSVVIVRNDKGGWTKPMEVDVLTSAAVNAGEVREQVHQAEEMRLLRERVKAAEEQRRRARERRRRREEELKRDEEDLRRTETTKEVANEEAEGTDNGNSSAKKSADAEDKKVAETSLDIAVEKAEATENPEDKGRHEAIPVIVEAEPGHSEGNEKATVAEVAHIGSTLVTDAELSTTSSNIESSSHPSGDAEGTRGTEMQPKPSRSEASEPTQDPYYLAEVQIDVQMYERIARILYLFHKRGARHLVLGSFGTGVFQNRIELVAGIFYDLLAKPEAKFKNAFDTVVFAILGGPTIKVFREIFSDSDSLVVQMDGENEVEEEGSDVEGMKDVESGTGVQVQGAGEKLVEHQLDGKAIDISPNAQSKYAQDIEMADMTREPISNEPELIDIVTQTAQGDQTHLAGEEVQGQAAAEESSALDTAQDLARP